MVKQLKQLIYRFWCDDCQIQNSPPEYDVWQALSTLGRGLTSPDVTIGLNVTEIPSNAIEPENCEDSKINSLQLIVKNQSLTVNSKAFSKLTSLTQIYFTSSHLKKNSKRSF